jgi:hypothetical protein
MNNLIHKRDKKIPPKRDEWGEMQQVKTDVQAWSW